MSPLPPTALGPTLPAVYFGVSRPQPLFSARQEDDKPRREAGGGITGHGIPVLSRLLALPVVQKILAFITNLRSPKNPPVDLPGFQELTDLPRAASQTYNPPIQTGIFRGRPDRDTHETTPAF